MTNIEEMNPKQYEKWFWSDYNSKCKECINKCKQSSRVILMSCNEFKNKEEK